MREGDTPLIDAARHGRADDVAALLADGADVNEPKTDETGASALYVTCQEGHAGIVRTLLAANASVDLGQVSRDRVQVVGLKGRPELNGKNATIGVLNAKGRYPVSFGGGEAVLIKLMNLVAI